MSLQITIPDRIAEHLGDDPEQELLEPYVVKLAKSGKLWTSDVQEILGLLRLETVQWSGERGVPYLNLSEEQLACS